MRSIDIVLALVVLATVVAAFAVRLRVPAPSLLVLAGLAAGLIPGVPRVEVTPGIVNLVVLPPLLYAAGQELSLRDLRAVWRPVAVLATGLVLASAAAVAAVAQAVTPLPASMTFADPRWHQGSHVAARAISGQRLRTVLRPVPGLAAERLRRPSDPSHPAYAGLAGQVAAAVHLDAIADGIQAQQRGSAPCRPLQR